MSSPAAYAASEDGAKVKAHEQITFRFCSECSNMLYPREDEQEHRLKFVCRTCQYSEDASSTCIFRNVLNNTAGETAGVTQDVGSDPTVGCAHPDLQPDVTRSSDEQTKITYNEEVPASPVSTANEHPVSPVSAASEEARAEEHRAPRAILAHAAAPSPASGPVFCTLCGMIVRCQQCGGWLEPEKLAAHHVPDEKPSSTASSVDPSIQAFLSEMCSVDEEDCLVE